MKSLSHHRLIILLSTLLHVFNYSDALRTHLNQLPAEDIIRRLVASSQPALFNATTSKPIDSIAASTSYLAPLLISRTPGSANLELIRHRMAEHFRRLQWSIEWDNFTAHTPAGPIRMANLIVTHRPKALRKLVLACHYDTKVEPKGFIGATDSAGPMALLVSLAEWIGPLLDLTVAERQAYTVQLIFFDGEEAIQQWTSTDSIYGSRNLYEKWLVKGSSVVPPKTFQQWPNLGMTGYENRLAEIDLFILLDLLGATEPWPIFRNYFDQTDAVYRACLAAELELKRLRLLSPVRRKMDIQYFSDSYPSAEGFKNPQDDHLPFLQAGVPVLHLIPQPFPAVWHTLEDDASAINPSVLNDYSRILRVFLTQYLQLESQIMKINSTI